LSHSGEKKRVGLSAALLKQPDVLLLDEPTNHLDIDALEWLADFLKPGGKDKDMAMLLVTHDRFFLEKVCSESKYRLVNITVLLQCYRTVQIP
jgi:ABC transport system ATP-binding/permease protein